MPRTETATCQDCGWHGSGGRDEGASAICGTACIRAMSCPPASARRRVAAAPRCSTMSAVTRTICAPRWSRSCSASTGFTKALAAGRSARPDRRPRQGARRLRPQGPGGRPPSATRLQHLRRCRCPGGCVGVLGCRYTALGAAQHLQGRRYLRRLRRRVQLHDEARHGGGVMAGQERIRLRRQSRHPPVRAHQNRQARMAADPLPLKAPRAPAHRLRVAPGGRLADPAQVPRRRLLPRRIHMDA